MARSIMLDEFHLTIRAPSTLRDTEYRAIKRNLNGRRLHERLHAAIRQILHGYRALLKVRVHLSR